MTVKAHIKYQKNISELSSMHEKIFLLSRMHDGIVTVTHTFEMSKIGVKIIFLGSCMQYKYIPPKRKSNNPDHAQVTNNNSQTICFTPNMVPSSFPNE